MRHRTTHNSLNHWLQLACFATTQQRRAVVCCDGLRARGAIHSKPGNEKQPPLTLKTRTAGAAFWDISVREQNRSYGPGRIGGMTMGEPEATRLVPPPWMGASFGMATAFIFLGYHGPMIGILAMLGGAIFGGLVDVWFDGWLARAKGAPSVAEETAWTGMLMLGGAIFFCIFWMLTVYTPLGA